MRFFCAWSSLKKGFRFCAQLAAKLGVEILAQQDAVLISQSESAGFLTRNLQVKNIAAGSLKCSYS
ncbi:MAG: hypothetical protein ACJA0W_004392 [Candidatus Azotimanducaceae bacterium]|jgi:hypothetical protein